MKFMVYNAGGLTLPVEAEPDVPFRFECPEEECGKRIILEGRITVVALEEFNLAVKNTIRENESFKPIEGISVRKYLFKGSVNGKYVELPAEAFEDFARRFIESLDSLIVIR